MEFAIKHSPINVWWSESQMVLHTEFRDGDVPAEYKNLGMLKEALEYLAESVKRVRPRPDHNGY